MAVDLAEPPPGFFSFESEDFALSAEEAEWLAERIAETAGDSMLGYMLSHRLQPLADAEAPSEDPADAHLPAELKAIVEHGRLFSLTIHGALLLYNLLLARRADQLGYEAGDLTGHYEDALRAWWAETSDDAGVQQWDRHAFWQIVQRAHRNISPLTVNRVNAWLDRISDGSAEKAATDAGLSSLVASRERRLKGPKSRLVNDRLLANWSGGSGTGRLVYRWGTVQNQLADVFSGLNGAGS